jgi:hypothetical protein
MYPSTEKREARHSDAIAVYVSMMFGNNRLAVRVPPTRDSSSCIVMRGPSSRVMTERNAVVSGFPTIRSAFPRFPYTDVHATFFFRRLTVALLDAAVADNDTRRAAIRHQTTRLNIAFAGSAAAAASRECNIRTVDGAKSTDLERSLIGSQIKWYIRTLGSELQTALGRTSLARNGAVRVHVCVRATVYRGEN